MSNRRRARRAAQILATAPAPTPPPTPVSAPLPASVPEEGSAPTAVANDSVKPWMGWPLKLAEWLSITAIFIFMLNQSWLKWMDPLIDFPKDLYLAWRVSEGDMLFRDVITWYGPLPQLAEGAGFHVFGVGIDTIVWMNIVLTSGVVLLVWGIFDALGTRLSRWLCVVVFIVVFAFGHYTQTANYNFIAPYVAQSTYGFAGLVLLLWAILRQIKSARSWWLGLAGLGLAIAYLDKPEPLLASLGALAVYGLTGLLNMARQDSLATNWRRALGWALRSAVCLSGGFFCLWLPIFLYFFCRGGLAYAWLAANFVPHTVMDTRFQMVIEHSLLMQRFFGFDQPWVHLINHLEAGAVLLLILGAMFAASQVWSRAVPYTPEWSLGLLVMLTAGGVGAWMGYHANFWMDVGTAFVFPVILAAAVAIGWSGWAAWRHRPEVAHLQGLAVVGTAAALMLVRMVLHGRIYQFGFFMMPLAVLFAIHLVVGEATRLPTNRPRGHLLLVGVFTSLVLYGVASLATISLKVYASKTAIVGEGRDRFYAFPARVSPNSMMLNPSSGALLNLMIHVFRIKTPNAKSLAVFPEGIAANYHLRVRSPLAEQEFHPVALGYVGTDHVLDELKANPPDAVLLHYRDYHEFGENFFADDEATGRPIMVWIAANYERVAKGGRTKYTVTGNLIDLLEPKPKPKPAAQPLYQVAPVS